MTPLVSIIVPVYEPHNEFDKTMQSLLNQTLDSFEIIIIDDASSKQIERINKYRSDPRVNIIRLSKNLGGGGARNIGLKNAVGKYIAFCDSDDVWSISKLEIQINFMERTNSCMSHTDIVLNKDSSNEEEKLIITPNQINLYTFLISTAIYCSTVCVERSVVNNAKFSERPIRHPFKFWVSLLESGIISKRVPGLKVNYIKRKNSVSSRKLRTIYYTILAYMSYPSNKLLSIWCLIIRIFNSFNSYSRINGLRKNGKS